MKQLSLQNLEKIKDKHYRYCIELIEKEENKILSEEERQTVRKLCCENPFVCKGKTISLSSDFKKYINGDIDYNSYYTIFRSDNNSDWNGVKLFEALDVKVCPYCGINYLTTVEKNEGNIITTATFDHYFPKKSREKSNEYGFLALNLYNLIPCCRNCNSTFKLGNHKPVLNPYFYDIEQMFEFELTPQSIINELVGVDGDFEIKTKFTDTVLCKNHNDVIAINERYKAFKNIAKTLIYKRQKYSKDYLKSLEGLDISLSNINLEEMLVKQDIFSNDEPLSKFKTDIWKQISNEIKR